MKDLLAEIKEYKCNKCIYNNEIYEFIEVNGVYFLLRDFLQSGIKLDRKEGINAIIRYWLRHKSDFIRERDEKSKEYLKSKINKILLDFFEQSDKFKEYKESGNWKLLIPETLTYQILASMDDGTIEKDIIAQYQKIISEYPDFVEKANEIKTMPNKDDQFKEYQIYFKLGIYKFHARNIDKLLEDVNSCVKDEPLQEEKNQKNIDFLQIAKQRFEDALLKNHKKENSKKSIEEYRTDFLNMLNPDFITHCYYGNEIYEFTGDNNEITVDGEKINLEKELAEWGARAYRMSIEANRIIDSKRLKSIFN